ncbi:MAG: DUF2334 domain-containing protein [Sphingomonadales bacterium]
MPNSNLSLREQAWRGSVGRSAVIRQATAKGSVAGGSGRTLLVSIHDVSPRFEEEIGLLVDRLAARLGAPKLAMLVVPDFWGEAPLSGAPHFRRKLRRWTEQGVEMFLHGWSHRDDSIHRSASAALKARLMTAREGEFLGLAYEEAARRLAEGRKLIEDAIGAPVCGFVAPAWLYGPGAIAALRDQQFPLAEDHMRIWRPSDGRAIARAPVVTWASRSRARAASSLAFARIAPTLLKPFRTVRLAVHPGDTRLPALLGSIDRTLVALTADRQAGRYRDLARANSENPTASCPN